MKLIIGVPTNGNVRSTTVTCLVENMFHVVRDIGEDLEGLNLIIPSTCLVHVNRNTIVEIGLEKGFSHVMFIDSDMIFPASAVTTLIKDDKDIVGGNYNVRGKFPLSRTVNYNYPLLPEEPFICDSVAAGFLLVKASVFKRIEPPWLSCRTNSPLLGT